MGTNRKRLYTWASVFVLAAAISGMWWALDGNRVESMETDDGIRMKFRTNGDRLEVYENEAWKPFFAKGINLGASLPGHFPGELPITKDDYLRWFAMMDEMGANVLRVYTIHPPDFYTALVEFNRSKDGAPLYLMQGIWSPEELLIEKQDAFLPEIREQFREEIRDAVAAVYGEATLPEKSGKASGEYRSNAGEYLIGWHVGTEWDPLMVDRTNELHRKTAPYRGSFFQAKQEASPFESWLAEMIDLVAEEESKYGWQHPISFTNWVTTDPLAHPGEPLYHEDLVSVDPTHVEPVDWAAGYFASYHVYPYYPDLFRYDANLQTVRNDKGEIDTYKAYLRQLKQHHKDMPILVTEFGVPASWGIAHIGLLGRDQGGHTEQRQGEIDAELLQEIHNEGYAGAILFVWQDEWFKKTWNTMPFELPTDRRSLWLNVLTNEKLFGIIGMHAGKEHVLAIDGETGDWDKLADNEKQRIDVAAPGFEEIWMAHDEAYVYIMARLEKPFQPESAVVSFGIDTLPGGNRHAPQLGELKLDEGLELLVRLGTAEDSQIQIASNYDFHTRLYGKRYGMLPVDEQAMQDDSGLFVPWKLAVGLEMEPPDSKAHYPMEEVVVGSLRRGTTDWDDPAYDSLAAWQAKGNVVELRIPWMLLGFADPSSLQAISYQDAGREFVTETAEGIRLLPWMERSDGTSTLASDATDVPYTLSRLPVYTWEPWEEVRYYERKKQSYYAIQKAFQEIDQPVHVTNKKP